MNLINELKNRKIKLTNINKSEELLSLFKSMDFRVCSGDLSLKEVHLYYTRNIDISVVDYMSIGDTTNRIREVDNYFESSNLKEISYEEFIATLKHIKNPELEEDSYDNYLNSIELNIGMEGLK